jgi:mono/diheme cytochrome c family protein
MTKSVHASVKRRAPELPNPVAPTDENLITGRKICLRECAGCHGMPGQAVTEDTADVLYPPAPPLPIVGREYYEAQIYWIAKHGIRRAGKFAGSKWDPIKNPGPRPPTSNASSPCPRMSSRGSTRNPQPL